MSSQLLTTGEARQRLNEIRHSGVSFEEKAHRALELGEQYLGADSGYLTRIETETNHWEATVSTASQDGQFPPDRELNLGTTYSRRTIAADEPITLHDAPAQGWEDDPAFETHGINFYHGTPLYLDGEPHGSLCFVAGDPRDEPFRNEETLLTGLIARMLEQELERQNYQTELTRRKNLINVLNRVLRHNMRNDMSVIRDETQLMTEQLGGSRPATAALDKIDDLIELCEKAREIEEIVDQSHDRTRTNLETLSQNVVADVGAEFPGASITLDVDAGSTAQVLPSLKRAVRELVENAAKHGGESPSVTVTVDCSPQTVEVRIADTGPGLSDQEREVLKTGIETPLIHGSGLGLWLVQWIADSHDGTVDATITDTGTVMTMSVPRAPATDDTQDLADLRQATDQYQAAFEESFDAQLLLDDQARIIESNPAAERIFGLEQAEFRGLSLAEFYPEEFDFEGCWSAFLDSINDPAWVYDDRKHVTFANQPNLDGLSIANEQLVGMPLSAFEGLFADPETYETWEAIIDDVLAGDVTEGDLDVTFDVQDDPLVMNFRAAPIPDSDDPTSVAVIASDITERKQREQVLEEYETIQHKTPTTSESAGIHVLHVDDGANTTEPVADMLEREGSQFTVETATSASEQYELLANRIENTVAHSNAEQQAATTQHRLRELSEVTHDIHWMVTADWSEFLFVNSAYEDVWGRSREKLLENPMDFLQGVHPADRNLVTTKMNQASNGEPVDFEFRVASDEDVQQWVWVQAEPIYDETAEPTRIAGFVRDVTERKERERILTQMESIVQKMNDGAVIVQDSVIKYANPRLSELLGYAEDELVETPMREFVAPDHRETVEKRHHERIAGDDTSLRDQYELEVLSDDGRRIPVEVNSSRIEYHGQPATIYIVRDITERTHQKKRFQALTEQSTDIITVLNPDGTCQYQSPLSKRVLGYEPGELVGEDAFEYVHPEDRQRVSEAFNEAITNPETTPTVELRFKHKDGSYIWFEANGNNQLDNPAIEGFVVNSRDITERKEREHREKRERDRLDKFAGTVSHDLRNPLNVAQSRLELVQDDCESEHLEHVERAQDRMEQLIEDVLSLTRAGQAIGETDVVDLPALTAACWQNVETDAAELVGETEATIQADETQLKQLLENLLRNAVEHVGTDVTITVGDLPDGFYLEDDGPGIADTERSEVFDPGYSTSEAGNGFGLSIVRDIAEAHEWSLAVTESSAGGARFEFSDVQTH